MTNKWCCICKAVRLCCTSVMHEGTLHLHAGAGFGLVSKGYNALSTALGTAVEVCLGVGQVVGEAAQEVG